MSTLGPIKVSLKYQPPTPLSAGREGGCVGIRTLLSWQLGLGPGCSSTPGRTPCGYCPTKHKGSGPGAPRPARGAGGLGDTQVSLELFLVGYFFLVIIFVWKRIQYVEGSTEYRRDKSVIAVTPEVLALCTSFGAPTVELIAYMCICVLLSSLNVLLPSERAIIYGFQLTGSETVSSLKCNSWE